MMKIGILSHYHNTKNYGGALQAYALCKTLNDMGYESEQIDIDFFPECINLDEPATGTKKTCRAKSLLVRIINRIRYHKVRSIRIKLQEAFRNFNENLIPHSVKQYNGVTITEAIDKYDVFIVGSDQVWNPIWYFEPFFLSFFCTKGNA